jgi:hypothetical protein
MHEPLHGWRAPAVATSTGQPLRLLLEAKEACDAWRVSDAEAHRREAMAPYVVEEREAQS